MALRLGGSIPAATLVTALIGWVFFNVSLGGRNLSYQTGAPQNWPVIYNLNINGADPIPWAFETTDWTGTTSYGDGRTVATSVPARPWHREAVEIQATWIEWATGQAWSADVRINHPEEMRAALTIHFAADGQISVYRPDAALRAGNLGRAATLGDYERIARHCGSAIASDDPAYMPLAEARAADLGVIVERIDAAGHPAPPRSDCSPDPTPD